LGVFFQIHYRPPKSRIIPIDGGTNGGTAKEFLSIDSRYALWYNYIYGVATAVGESPKGSKIEEAVLESGRAPDFIFFLGETNMKRRRVEARPNTKPARMSWAERIAEHTARTHSRRFEHLIHGNFCGGGYDHLLSPKEVRARQRECAKICGLCRYINSLAIWPVPNYRRPPDGLMKSLEELEWCLTFQSIKTAWPSTYWRKFHRHGG